METQDKKLLIDYKKVNIYQSDKLILNDIDLQVSEGEFVYIIGKVGSGKSSLLKTTYCELDIEPEEAEHAVVIGRDLKTIRRKDIPSLRKEMGVIFQDFQLLHDQTVYRNLRFVLRSTGWKDKKQIDERIEEVLNAVKMGDKKDKLPHELSGGEQQHIAIARAILNHPKIIIADEPTGNLDPETAHHIVELLRGIAQNGTSVVMTTHNITLLGEHPGTVYRCENGQMFNVTNEYNKESGTDKQ